MNTRLILSYSLLLAAAISLWCALHVLMNKLKEKTIESEDIFTEDKEVN